jgi:hypothetical protein
LKEENDMRKRLALALALGFSLLAATPALAGFKWTNKAVTISGNTMNGALGSAWNSTDYKQYIGCSITAYATSTSGVCWGSDASGTYRSCSTFSPSMIQTIGSIQADSFIQFSWDPSNNTCTSLVVHHTSYTEPKR